MALTKVTGGTISTTSDYQINNIVGVAGTFTTLNVSGVLTYEDVTNIESVGVATFKDDVEFHGTGAGISSAFWDKSANEFKFKDNVKLSFGDGRDIQLSHNGSDSVISHIGSATGALKILSGGAQSIECIKAGAVNIAHNGNSKLSTTSTGATLDHTLTIGGAAGSPGRINFIEGGAVSEIRVTRNSDANSDLQFKTERGDGTVTRAKIDYSGDFVVPSNKIGIGTITPATTLDVRGVVSVDYNASHALRFYTQPRNNWSSISNTATDGNANLSIKTSQGEAINITYSKKVGIGTDDPAKKLEVWDATQGVIRIRGGGSGSNSSRKADLSLFASGAREYVVRADASDAAFKIVDVTGSNAERLTITSGGQVGINTTTLVSGNNYATLHVGGDASSSGGGNVLIGNIFNSGNKHPKNCQLTLAGQHNSTGYNADGQVKLYITGSDNDSGVNYPLYMEDENAGVQMVARQNGTAFGVGIGIAAPTSLLHIKNGGTADAIAKIESESGYDARLQLDTSNGGGAGAHIDFVMDGTTKGGIEYVNNGSSINTMIFRNTANTERYRITASGTHVFGGNSAAPIVDNGELLYRGNSTQTFESLPQSFYLYGDSLGSGTANAGTGMVFGGNYKTDGSQTTFAGIHGIKENTTNNQYGGALVFGVRTDGGGAWERLRINSSGSIGQGTKTPRTPDGTNADNPLNGTGTDGSPVFTIYGDSPAINLVSSTTASGDYSLINFGRTGSTTNPYRAVIGYKQSDDILRINAQNAIAFDAGGNINTGEAARIDSSGRILSYGTLGAGNLPLSGNAANAAIQIRSNNKYKGIAFGEGAVNGTIGLGGDDSSTALVYTANANPANLGGGEHATHEWWSGNAGGGGPAKFMVLTTSGNLGIGTEGPDAKLDVGGAAPEIRLTNTNTSRSYINWYNHYGSSPGHNHNCGISYNEGNANWEFKLYRADSQANSPYGNIQFYTGHTSTPTLALNITRPGSVVMPKQPCCVMWASSNTTWSSGWTKIPVNNTRYDVGNNFDSGNNRYSIPITGKYAIGYNVEINIGSGQTWIYLVPRINRNDSTSQGAGINYADFAPMSNNGSNHYYSKQGHWICSLSQGDTVTFETHGAGNAWTIANGAQSHYYVYQVA